MGDILDNIGNVPLLGGDDGPPQRVGGFSPMVMVRGLDRDGTMLPATTRMQRINTPNGPVMAKQAELGRDQFVTAEDLVDEIREVVRDELKNFLKVIRKEVDDIERSGK